MKKSGLFVLSISFLFIIFLISVISANTVVAGKIYNADYSDTISGASVSVDCNGESLDTTSLSDGAYAVKFEGNCIEGTIVTVTATKNNLRGEATGIVYICTEKDCASDLMAVINPSLKVISTPQTTTTTSSSGGGGGSSRYYLCGNGICDSGETPNTCAKDCPVLQENKGANEVINLNYNSGNSDKEYQEGTEIQKGITGAVIGALTSTGGIIAIILIVILGVGFFSIRKKKSSKKSNNEK